MILNISNNKDLYFIQTMKYLFTILVLFLLGCSDQKTKLMDGSWTIRSYYESDVSSLGNNLEKLESPWTQIEFFEDSVRIVKLVHPYEFKKEGIVIKHRSGEKLVEITELTNISLQLLNKDEDEEVHHFFSFGRNTRSS